jgi:excisionase family DNA binding protein
MEKETLLTTPQVAARLGVSARRVLALIESGRLPSQQFGRDHVVKESDLHLVEDRKVGRPPKSSLAPEARATGRPNANNGTPVKKRGRVSARNDEKSKAS